MTKANVSCTVSLAHVIVRRTRVFISLKVWHPKCRATVTGSFEYRLSNYLLKIQVYLWQIYHRLREDGLNVDNFNDADVKKK